MEEISTSFCFICLLHLANEQGLKLDVGEGDELDLGARLKEKGLNMDVDEEEDEDVESVNVGNIWGLKVRILNFHSSHCDGLTRFCK